MSIRWSSRSRSAPNFQYLSSSQACFSVRETGVILVISFILTPLNRRQNQYRRRTHARARPRSRGYRLLGDRQYRHQHRQAAHDRAPPCDGVPPCPRNARSVRRLWKFGRRFGWKINPFTCFSRTDSLLASLMKSRRARSSSGSSSCCSWTHSRRSISFLPIHRSFLAGTVYQGPSSQRADCANIAVPSEKIKVLRV